MKDTNPKSLVDLVVGTRPNIVKAAPLYALLRRTEWCHPRLVFLMQHTDPALSTETFADLGISMDEVVSLPLTRDGFGSRLGEMIETYGKSMYSALPHAVVVFGDVDSTLAAAVIAKRMRRPLVHVEAGLRSGDRSMPEELNRIMVDAISDLLLTTTDEATTTLASEGQPSDKVHFVGNLMIDSLLSAVDENEGIAIAKRLGVERKRFIIATFHRPDNVDTRASLLRILDLLEALCRRLPVVLPMHPRTLGSLKREGLMIRCERIEGLILSPALRYREFVCLQACAAAMVTDSGGIQEESAVLGVPCIIIRDSTERAIAMTGGLSELASPEAAPYVIDGYLAAPQQPAASIPGWDGHSAGRVAGVLRGWLETHT